MPARPYQIVAVRSVLGLYGAGHDRLVAQGPTAFGKTFLFTELIEPLALDLGKRTLIISHREEIIDGAANTAKLRYPHATVGIVAEGKSAGDAQIVVAMVQSLSSDKRLAEFDWREFNLILIDECHHSTASNYTKILEYFHVNKLGTNDSSACLIGFTATVNRHDKIGLERVYDRLAYKKSLREMVEEGWLAPVRAYRFSTNVTIPKLKLDAHGDLPRKSLASLLNDDERNQLILDKFQPFSHLPTIGFCFSVEHADKMTEMSNAAGIPSAAINGATPKKLRAEYLRKFLNEEIRCLFNYEVLTEGTDLPLATVILMMRPTLSEGLYFQMAGRALRRWPSPEMARTHVGYVKKEAIILDFVDNSVKHRVATAPTLFGLPPCLDPQGKALTVVAGQVDDIRDRNHGILPRLDFTSIADLETTITSVDILGDHELPPLAKKYSKLAWFKINDEICAIWLDSQRATFEIHTDLLGQCNLFMSQSGTRLPILEHKPPSEAFSYVDRLTTREDKILRDRSKGWRREPPSAKQCFRLYSIEPALHSKFPTGKDFYDFAKAEYGRNNRAYSKGGISGALDRVTRAK